MNTNQAGVAIAGEQVRELRKLRGETLKAFSERACITFQYLSQIETGARLKVSPPVFARICDALEIEDRRTLVVGRIPA